MAAHRSIALNRAFSARPLSSLSPGAMPQTLIEVAPSALHTLRDRFLALFCPRKPALNLSSSLCDGQRPPPQGKTVIDLAWEVFGSPDVPAQSCSMARHREN